MTVLYARTAQKDRFQIYLDSAERFGVPKADGLVERIDATLQNLLAAFPKSGRARTEFGLGLRSLPVVPYVAFYRIKNRRVEVVRILHGRRDMSEEIFSLLIAG
jgi:toxin ParE1/3/4